MMHFSPVVVNPANTGTRRRLLVFSFLTLCIVVLCVFVSQDRRPTYSTSEDYISSVFPQYKARDADLSFDLPNNLHPNEFPSQKSKTQKMYIPVRFNPQATEDDIMKEMIMRWGKIIEAIEALRRTIACIDGCTNTSRIPNVTLENDPGGNETDLNVTVLGECLDTCGLEEHKKTNGLNQSEKALRSVYISQLDAALSAQVSLDNRVRSLAHTVVSGRIAPLAAASKLQSLFLSSDAPEVPSAEDDEAGQWIYVNGPHAFARSASSDEWRVARIGAIGDSDLGLGAMLWVDSPFHPIGPTDPAPKVCRARSNPCPSNTPTRTARHSAPPPRVFVTCCFFAAGRLLVPLLPRLPSHRARLRLGARPPVVGPFPRAPLTPPRPQAGRLGQPLAMPQLWPAG